MVFSYWERLRQHGASGREGGFPHERLHQVEGMHQLSLNVVSVSPNSRRRYANGEVKSHSFKSHLAMPAVSLANAHNKTIPSISLTYGDRNSTPTNFRRVPETTRN
ncbi:hypothetical protein [Nostoc sp.]|uniref:hypothetical protein n=1 Tax=Nostoc sp. TaxID=1180 RepID=UPI002FFAF2D4